jgi:hypothetical protein
MKRLILFISILALALLPIGCMDNIMGMIKGVADVTIEEVLKALTSTYTIKVDGTDELNFSGEYMVVTTDFDTENRVAFSSDPIPVEGQVPKQYRVTDATAVAVMFQKQDEEGTLRVEIWKGGDLIDSAETTDPWGAVLVMSTGVE